MNCRVPTLRALTDPLAPNARIFENDALGKSLGLGEVLELTLLK